MLYLVLLYENNMWVTALETYDEKEAVAAHRKLEKQGYQVIIDYEETK